MSDLTVDWDALRGAAPGRSAPARTPRTPTFQVGAAALVDDGRIVTGCNVENASYGLTLCAECGLVSSLISGAVAGWSRSPAWTSTVRVLMPCGRCRQLLFEHGGDECLVDTPLGILPMAEVLPQAFGPDQLRNGKSDS